MLEKMMAHIAPYRIWFFMLVSFGLHAGALYSGLQLSPVQTRPSDAPVRVALLPDPPAETSDPHEIETNLDAEPRPAPTSPPVVQKTPEPVEKPKPTRRRESIPPATETIQSVPPPAVASKPEPKPEPEPELASENPPSSAEVSEAEASAADDLLMTAAVPMTEPAKVPPVASVREAETADDVHRARSINSPEPLIEATPDYLNNPLPDYPYIARQRHWEGVVWLLVDVTADGLVDDLSIEKSCGHKVLDRAATRSVRFWQFTPAKRAGLPVASQVRIPVRFSLEDS